MTQVTNTTDAVYSTYADTLWYYTTFTSSHMELSMLTRGIPNFIHKTMDSCQAYKILTDMRLISFKRAPMHYCCPN